MSDTELQKLQDDLERVREEILLNRFHADTYMEKAQALYPRYCVALARVVDYGKAVSK